METSAIIILSIAAAWVVYRAQISGTKTKKHKILMEIERNKQVYHFRTRMIYVFDVAVSKAMPSYHDMLNSDKPLTAKEWIDVDKLICLN